MFEVIGKLLGAPDAKIPKLNDVHTIEIAALGPRATKLRKWLARGAGLGALVAAGVALADMAYVDWEDVARGGAVVVGTYVSALGALWFVLRDRRTITFTENEVIVRAPLWKRAFDRNVPMTFALASHDLAEMEHERAQRAQMFWARRGWSVRRQFFFAKSYHLIIEQLGERRDIMGVYGEKTAYTLRAKLQAILDTHGKNIGVATEPEKDWPVATGELPAV